MFVLRKIEGGRMNVPETKRVKASAGTYHNGTILALVDGKYVAANGDVKASAICMQEAVLAAEGELVAANLYPDMIFEVPITAFSATTQIPGAAVTLSAGVSVTATAAADGKGAVVEDVLTAAAAGDTILVKFKV